MGSLVTHTLGLTGNMPGLSLYNSYSTNRNNDSDNSDDAQNYGNNESRNISLDCDSRDRSYPYGALTIGTFYFLGILIGGVGGGYGLAYGRRFLGCLLVATGVLFVGLGAFLLGYGWLWGPWDWARPLLKQGDCPKYAKYDHLHDIVTQQLLTLPYYCNTLIAIGRANMANVVPIEKQVAIINARAEGSGIRQIERMTGVHRDTIMQLGVRVGQGCAGLLDRKMRNLSCQQLQFDEIWGFIGNKAAAKACDGAPYCSGHIRSSRCASSNRSGV
jgi:hypothetical protein